MEGNVRRITPKWPFIVMAIVVLLFLVYVGSTAEDSTPAVASPVATTEPTSTPEPTVEVTEVKSTPAPTLPSGPSKEEIFELVKDSAYENMSEYISSMTFQDNVCLITYNVEGATFAAQQNSSAWQKVVDNSTNLSLQQYEVFAQYGYEDVQCAITILNEFNTENTLLLVVNGDVLYNAAIDD